MSRGGRIVRSERKWSLVSYDFYLDSLGPTAYLPIQGGRDLSTAEELNPEELQPWERINRIIGCFGVKRLNEAVTTAPQSVAVIGLGVLRGTTQSSAQPNVLSNSWADKPWVWRSLYTLPEDLEIQNYDPALCRFDWPLRGGRGTNVDRDVDIQLVCSLSGVQFGGPEGSVVVRVVCMALGEDSP